MDIRAQSSLVRTLPIVILISALAAPFPVHAIHRMYASAQTA
jgi:hypothetical protein